MQGCAFGRPVVGRPVSGRREKRARDRQRLWAVRIPGDQAGRSGRESVLNIM